jgi:hypothetical protein
MPESAPVIRLPAALHRFVALVLGNPAVQARLGAVLEADTFVAEAVAVASEHAIPLDSDVLAANLRPDPLGMGRFGPAPIELNGWPPQGWLPARTVETGGAPAFDWLWFGTRRLTSSFYADEVSLANALPLNWLLRIRTGLDAVMAGAEHEAALPLGGLIYHMSRCGSTLLAQMLGAVPQHAVLSEPGPLDDLLLWAWREQLSPEATAPAVRAIVAALGRQRGIDQERLFIKTDAWHTLLMPQLHTAFPDVPWVYLFRDPLEVLVSHQKMPGIQIVAGIMPEALFGISGGLDLPPLEYAARALRTIGEAAIEHGGLRDGLFVSYPDLVEAAPTRVVNHFGLALNAPEQAAMRAAATIDSKSRAVPFAADSQTKRAAASPALQQIVTELLAATNRRLESFAYRM